jgi:hypothetical protein
MYFYHATAIALGGRLGKDADQPLKVPQASCALAVTGGCGLADAPSFSSSGISFQSAKSEVSGEEKNVNGLDVYVTKASVIIKGLNIQNALTADIVEAHLISEHRTGDYEASTVIFGSHFDNLKIKGAAVTLELSDEMLHQYPTFWSMEADFENDFSRPWVLACLEGHGLPEASATTEDLRAAFDAYSEQKALCKLKQLVVCSFVTKVNGLGGGITAWGPIIAVPNFGNIYLGELMIWPWMRCLTMFRVELSSGGSISGGTVGSGGTTIPPGGHPGLSDGP